MVAIKLISTPGRVILFIGGAPLDNDQIIRAAISFVIVALLVPATLWYLGIRFRRPQLKVWGVIIAATYVLAFGYNVAHDWLDWFPVVYRTDMQGPDERTREASIVVDGQYHVNAAGSRHQMVLTPISKYGEQQTAPLTLGFEVQTPSGQVVAKGRETLGPSKGSNWTALKTEFVSPEEGEHKLILEIPKPVRKVRIEISERKK
jgi:hypothetical protein